MGWLEDYILLFLGCGLFSGAMLIWAVLSDEQMRKRWPFSLLNDEQMSNKVGVEHQPVILGYPKEKILLSKTCLIFFKSTARMLDPATADPTCEAALHDPKCSESCC